MNRSGRLEDMGTLKLGKMIDELYDVADQAIMQDMVYSTDATFQDRELALDAYFTAYTEMLAREIGLFVLSTYDVVFEAETAIEENARFWEIVHSSEQHFEAYNKV